MSQYLSPSPPVSRCYSLLFIFEPLENIYRGWAMSAIRGFVAVVSVSSLALGCGGGGDTVNYNPATGPDGSPPTVNLLITRTGAPDVEVQGQPGANPKKSTSFGNPAPAAKSDFSVLATAKDPESGIKDLKIVMTRTVCFTGSGGGNNSAPFGTVTRKEAKWTDQTHAPTSPSLGETGIIDNTPLGTSASHLDETNLLVFKNAQGTLMAGKGVATKWGVEATNFAGLTTYSDVIYVLAGDNTCAALP